MERKMMRRGTLCCFIAAVLFFSLAVGIGGRVAFAAPSAEKPLILKLSLYDPSVMTDWVPTLEGCVYSGEL